MENVYIILEKKDGVISFNDGYVYLDYHDCIKDVMLLNEGEHEVEYIIKTVGVLG